MEEVFCRPPCFSVLDEYESSSNLTLLEIIMAEISFGAGGIERLVLNFIVAQYFKDEIKTRKLRHSIRGKTL